MFVCFCESFPEANASFYTSCNLAALFFKGFGELEIQRISRESELPDKRKTPDPPGLEPRTLLVMSNSPADSLNILQ